MKSDLANRTQKAFLEDQRPNRPVKSSFRSTVVGVMALMGIVGLGYSGCPRGAAVESWKPHEIKKGDTYNDIANTYGGNEIFRLDIVDQMEDKNGIEPGKLQPGNTILIPKDAYEKRGYHVIKEALGFD